MRTSQNGSRTRVKDPVDLLRGDIAAIKHDIASLVGNRLGALGVRAKDTLTAATDGVNHVAEVARDRAGVAHKRLSSTAAARPLTTIAVAAAAGAVGAGIIGWLRHR